MFGKLFKRFGKKPVVVPGMDRLAEGEGRTVEVGDVHSGDGVQFLLCRIEGKVHAIDTLCPHEGGRIAPGPLHEGKFAVCPLHNYKFDPRDGGKAVGVTCAAARVYQAEEVDGACEVRL